MGQLFLADKESNVQILSIGEALIDFKEKEQANLTFEGFVGGSPLNVAVAASRLGPQVGFASQLSTDMFGEQIVAHMKANGVAPDFVVRSDDPTTLAFVGEEDGEATFTFLANGAADRRYDPQPRPSLPAEVAFIMFGSVSLLNEPAASAITDIVAQHQAQATIILDPNVRPALIHDRDEYRADLARWVTLCDILKISTQDLGWLYPDKAPDDVATGWLEQGPKIVIVTSGSEGVRLFRKNHEVIKLETPKVEVVDTVGAGDTFTGSLMVALHDRAETLNDTPLEALPDETWRDVLTFAAAAAALNCTRAGADPPDRGELEAFMR